MSKPGKLVPETNDSDKRDVLSSFNTLQNSNLLESVFLRIDKSILSMGLAHMDRTGGHDGQSVPISV